MHKVILVAVLVLVISVFASGQVQNMQMVAPGQGWALDQTKLFWTADKGAHWADITPHAVGYITDVFFLDSSHGWALISSSDETSDVNTFSYTLARTADAGKTWSMSPVPVPSQKTKELSGGRGWIDFVDPMHGWAVLKAKSTMMATWGPLLMTSDGGASWKELSRAPVAGRPTFATTTDGCIAGITGGGEIYSTRDGGKTWTQTELLSHDDSSDLPTHGTYGQIKFVDSKHGFIPVSLQPATGSEMERGTALVLFETEDACRTWKQNRTIHDKAFSKSGAPMIRVSASALVISSTQSEPMLIAAFHDPTKPDRLSLIDVKPGEVFASKAKKTNADEVLLRQNDTVVKLSFVSASEGWARTNMGSLLSTADGGMTWKDISPIPMSRPAVAKMKH